MNEDWLGQWQTLAAALNPSGAAAFFALGPQREHQQRWQRMAEAFCQAQAAQTQLARLWSDTLREAAAAFAMHCADPAHAQTPPRELYDHWIECAEQAYARMAHGAVFCATQAALLNAQNLLRNELQALFERWCKEFDLPTRSELNSLHRSVKALRAQLARSTAPAPPRPKPKKKRAAATRRRRQ